MQLAPISRSFNHHSNIQPLHGSRQPAMKGKTQEAERIEHSAERIVIQQSLKDATMY
jgi:hypothetical protein